MPLFYIFMPIISILSLIIPFYFIYLIFFKSDIYPEIREQEEKGIQYPKFLDIALIIIIIGYNVFLYNINGLGIGISLFNSAVLIGLFLILGKNKYHLFTNSIIILGFICGVMITYRANEFVWGVNIAAILLIYALLILIALLEKINWTGLWLSNAIWLLIIRFLRNIPLFIKTAITNSKNNKIIGIIKTVGITLLIIAVFGQILSAADPIFNQIISSFLSQLAGRTIGSIFIATFFTILLTSLIRMQYDKTFEIKVLSLQDIFIPVTALVTLFAVFIFVQIKYLFGGHLVIQEFGLTYSEYVRKGFIELLIATFLGGLIAYITILKQRSIGQELKLKIVNTVLIVELAFMLISAFIRDKIYLETYGLTRVRLIGIIFLLWLTGFLATLLLLNIVKTLHERYFFLTIVLLSTVVVLSLNIMNIDKMIVSQNLPHTEYSPKDYFYINTLSEDAVDGWMESITFATDTFNELYKKPILTTNEKKLLADVKLSMLLLRQKREYLDTRYSPISYVMEKYYSDTNQKNCPNNMPCQELTKIEYQDQLERLKNKRGWQSYNYGQYKAYTVMYENKPLFFEQVDCLIKQIKNYQAYYKADLIEEERYRTEELTYPFVVVNLNYYPQSVNDIRRDIYYEKTNNLYQYPDDYALEYTQYDHPTTCLLNK